LKDKSVLHDHLDGGLRPTTIIELAEKSGIKLPTTDKKLLENWFFENISSELNQVFNKFELTISVMQDIESLERIAYEAVQDLTVDGISAGELRYAPLQHLRNGLNPQTVIDSVSRGLQRGMDEFGGSFKSILCAMRQNEDSSEVAELAISNYFNGVVGFDLAGPEYGHPPSKHIEACKKINKSDIGLTIHAGEAADFSYIDDAIFNCGAQRIGHGWQVIEGCIEVGELFEPNTKAAEYILEEKIPLEICISSNIKSGASNITLESHPVLKLFKSGFNITLNPDNRLMASTKLSKEYEIAKKYFGLTEDDEDNIIQNTRNSLF
jgi:adenosine deaminase|tara:strand:- start:670 stop:1638 length:969 start_codon:yes stop_codon:yes gene_type:complete